MCDVVFPSVCLPAVGVPPSAGGVAAAAGGNGLTPEGGKPKHQRSYIFYI